MMERRERGKRRKWTTPIFICMQTHMASTYESRIYYREGEGAAVMHDMHATYPHASMAHEAMLFEKNNYSTEEVHRFIREKMIEHACPRMNARVEQTEEPLFEAVCGGKSKGDVLASSACTALSFHSRLSFGVSSFVVNFIGSGTAFTTEASETPHPYARGPEYERDYSKSATIRYELRRHLDLWNARVQDADATARLMTFARNAVVPWVTDAFATHYLPPASNMEIFEEITDEQAELCRGPLLKELISSAWRASDEGQERPLSGLFADDDAYRTMLAYDMPVFFEERCIYIAHIVQAMLDEYRLVSSCEEGAVEGMRFAEISQFIDRHAYFVEDADGAAMNCVERFFERQCVSANQRSLLKRAMDRLKDMRDHRKLYGTSIFFKDYFQERCLPYMSEQHADDDADLTSYSHASPMAILARISPTAAAVSYAGLLARGDLTQLAAQDRSYFEAGATAVSHVKEWRDVCRGNYFSVSGFLRVPRQCERIKCVWTFRLSTGGTPSASTATSAENYIRLPSVGSDILRENDSIGYRENVPIRMPDSLAKNLTPAPNAATIRLRGHVTIVFMGGVAGREVLYETQSDLCATFGLGFPYQ